MIATCSFDRTAAIWEEMIGETKDGRSKPWIKRTSLVDSRTSVTDVKFAPKHMGLQLVGIQGTKIIQYCACPAGRVTYNFHSPCIQMYLSFKSIYNKEHMGFLKSSIYHC